MTGETPVTPRSFFSEFSESRHEGITDRDSESGDVCAIKLHVVVNGVVVDLRANESVPPEVISDVTTKVKGKMVAADVVGAAGEAVAVELGVEPQIFATNSRHHIAAEFFTKFASVHGIEIVKDRAIRSHSEGGGVAFSV